GGVRGGLGRVGIGLRSLELDTAIAAYLIDPAENRYELDDLLSRYTGDSFPADGAPEGQLDLDGGGADDTVVTARQALAVSRLAPALTAALDKQGMKRL